jgi:uridine phosphorylase
VSDDNSALLRAKAYDQPSVVQPANLLREGRRQRGRPDVAVPAVCLLDPDGDIVRHLTTTGQATEHPGWACYHTTLWTFDLDGQLTGLTQPVVTGATWTTDAPYRETAEAIAHAEPLGIVAVEMEAAALDAYAMVRERDVICVAHVTNTMATDGDDFDKGRSRRRPRRPRGRRRHQRTRVPVGTVRDP